MSDPSRALRAPNPLRTDRRVVLSDPAPTSALFNVSGGYGTGIATPESRPLAFLQATPRFNPAGDYGTGIATPESRPLARTFAPSGDAMASLTTGVPSASWPQGFFDFASNVLILGADPTVDRAGFGARLAAAIQQRIAASVARASYISITKGSQTTLEVPRALNLGAGVNVDVPLASLTGRSVRGWWLQISGMVLTPGPWQLQWLNDAIATALAASVTFPGWVDAEYRARLPRAAAPYTARFRAPDACSGGADLQEVVARACTRVVRNPAQAFPGMDVMTPIPAPATNGAGPGSAGVGTPTTGGQLRVLCTVTTASKFWLRPNATFDRIGPEYPARSRVEILDDQTLDVLTQGSLRLYRVRVNGAEGYAAMSAQDVATCSGLRGSTGGSSTGGSSTGGSSTGGSSTGGSSTGGSSTGGSSTGGSGTRPETGTSSGTRLPTVLQAPPVDEGWSPWTWAALSAAVVGTGGVLYWKKDDIRGAWQKMMAERDAKKGTRGGALPATRQG